jgi:hypothetical protein
MLAKDAMAQVEEVLGKGGKDGVPSLEEQRKQGESLLKEMANCIVEH